VVAPVFGCPVCLGRSLFIPPPHCHLHSRHHQALWPCTTRVVSVLSPTPVALHNVRGGCRWLPPVAMCKEWQMWSKERGIRGQHVEQRI